MADRTIVLSRSRVVLAALVLALAGLGLSVTTAEAALARVSGVSSAGEDNYNARLKVRWSAVSGASYQVRWAGSTTGLARAAVQSVGTTVATSPALNRCVTNYVQVRAVKRGAVGPWSAAKGLRFHNGYPTRAVLSGVGLDNAVKFTWKWAANVTRYRLRWNAAEWGKFAGGDGVVGGGWFNQYARSAVLKLPTTPAPGDKMMGVAYANPVWGQMDTRHVCRSGTAISLGYKPVFPKAPVPGPGDDLRMATYNVELFPNNTDSPGRINGMVKNITDHNLSVVALQEATAATASSLESKLASKWKVATPQPDAAQQILYDGSVFRAVANGVFDVPNPRVPSRPLATPWVVLRLLAPSSQQSQDVFVTSIHFSENTAKTQMEKKHDVNVSALAALRAIEAANTGDLPVIAAGDYRYLREPFIDRAGYVEGPPTFVRNGFFDAMAAVRKVNFNYTTVNGHKNQLPILSGVASRSDYIMLKGFEGSRAYVNVANWKYNGAFVSDHNLVYADVTIPYR
ncbi:MAG: hypothetical protein NTV23_03145 [Propionibacteriales bacterium]|nr:hypothetical protein [Propionibacteriales bacterium]